MILKYFNTLQTDLNKRKKENKNTQQINKQPTTEIEKRNKRETNKQQTMNTKSGKELV